ncbi:MAG: YCF48-related protein [Limisphaerales bacterium]
MSAQTFLWPATDASGNETVRVSQDYAALSADLTSGNLHYHSGIDIAATPPGAIDNVVRAAADGTVFDTAFASDGTHSGGGHGGWGNAVILQHANGLFSVYAHMAAPPAVTIGQSVTAGAQLGIIGQTGNATGIHLHFEVRQDGLWSGGYFDDIPDGYRGYRDPRLLILSPFAETSITPVVVKVMGADNLHVRSGPGTAGAPARNTYAALTDLRPGQHFVAWAQNGQGTDNAWYKLYLPHANGNISEWAAQTFQGVTYLVADASVSQVQVKNSGIGGLFVRIQAGTDQANVMTSNGAAKLKVWDGQRFAVLSQATVSGVTWYEIDLPTSANQATGWISGDYADYFPPSTGPAFTYSLAAGLNFISFPFTPSANGSSLLSDVVAGIANNLLVAKAAVLTGTFQVLPLSQITCQAKVGYILLLKQPCTLTVSGAPADPGVTLRATWNLVGVTVPVKPQVDPKQIYPTAFTYDERTGLNNVSIAGDGLQPGIAYFVFSWGDNNVLMPSTPVALTDAHPRIQAQGDSHRRTPKQGTSEVIGTDFTATVTVAQQAAPQNVVLAFGMNSSATDAYDSQFDQIKNIPFPGTLDAFLDTLYSTNITAPSSQKDWQMTVRSQSLGLNDTTFNSKPVQISWQIPATGTIDPNAQFQLLDSVGNVLVTDMRTTQSTSFTPTKAGDERDYVIRGTVQPPPPVNQAPVITSGPPPSGTVGESYSFTVRATGNPAPTFSVLSGSLPQGLVLSSGGLLSGMPTTANSYTFTVQAANGVNPPATQVVTLVIAQSTQAPAITSGPPPSATVNQGYSFPFTATGSPAPSFSVASGALPPGITLSPAGTLAGTPTQTGTFTFTVQASNGVGQAATQVVTLVIAPPGSWTVVRSGGTTNYLGVCFLDANEGWVVGSYGAILHTKDGGATWEQQVGPGDWQYYSYYSVYFADRQNGWSCGLGNGGVIIHTSDGGQTWSKQFVGGSGASVNPTWITGWGTSRLWAATQLGLLYSTDSGATWRTNAVAALWKVRFVTPQIGYATTGSPGSIMATRDGGATWTQLMGLTEPAIDDVAAVGTHLWAVGDRIFDSADAGTTWTEPWEYQEGLGGPLRCVRFVDANTGWAVAGDNGTILHTVNGGTSWTSEMVSMQAGLWDASFVNGGGWAVGDAGTILKYTGAVAIPPRSSFLEKAHLDRAKGFSLSFVVEPGRTYTVQGSPDLSTWADLTNTTPTGSSLDFVDAAATNTPSRLYRTIAR